MCTSPEFVKTYSKLLISVSVSGLTILLRVLENLVSEKKSLYLFKKRKLSVSILANMRLQSQTQDQHFWIMQRIRKNRSRVCCLNTLTHVHTCYIKYIGKTESSISHVQYTDILLSCVANV